VVRGEHGGRQAELAPATRRLEVWWFRIFVTRRRPGVGCEIHCTRPGVATRQSALHRRLLETDLVGGRNALVACRNNMLRMGRSG
jgi:hypothetical protein